MEANSEKIPMIATACEERGIDFQNSVLGRLTGELCVRFKIVFLLTQEDTILPSHWVLAVNFPAPFSLALKQQDRIARRRPGIRSCPKLRVGSLPA